MADNKKAAEEFIEKFAKDSPIDVEAVENEFAAFYDDHDVEESMTSLKTYLEYAEVTLTEVQEEELRTFLKAKVEPVEAAPETFMGAIEKEPTDDELREAEETLPKTDEEFGVKLEEQEENEIGEDGVEYKAPNELDELTNENFEE